MLVACFSWLLRSIHLSDGQSEMSVSQGYFSNDLFRFLSRLISITKLPLDFLACNYSFFTPLISGNKLYKIGVFNLCFDSNKITVLKLCFVYC